MTSLPHISTVIPTFNRPDIVTRAVRSVLKQTFSDLEVIVVVDGRDDATVSVLQSVEDPRLRVLVPERNLGNAGARNHGIAAARAEWIALLDDDDLWFAEKLERQVAFARGVPDALPVISCRFEAANSTGRYIWPKRGPRPGEATSDYLFTRSGTSVEGAIQTSTLLVPTRLFHEAPFDPAVKRYVDLDWLLRAAQVDGFALYSVPGEPLSAYSMDEARVRISNEADWHTDVDWIRQRDHLVTRRAYAAFLLTLASIRAEKSRDKRAYLPLLSEAMREGRPSLGEIAFHTANTFLPRRMRQGLTSVGSLATSGAEPFSR